MIFNISINKELKELLNPIKLRIDTTREIHNSISINMPYSFMYLNKFFILIT